VANPTSGLTSVIAQLTGDPAAPYVVPADGQITEWNTNQSQSGFVAGTQLGLVVLRAGQQGSYKVVGLDLQTLPVPLPPDGIASFQIANPIKVAAGDLLGLWSPNTVPPACEYLGQFAASDSAIVLGPLLSVLFPGQVVPVEGSQIFASFLLDMAATLVPSTRGRGRQHHRRARQRDRGSAGRPVLDRDQRGFGRSADHVHRHGPRGARDRFRRGRVRRVRGDCADGDLHDQRSRARAERARGHRRDAHRRRELPERGEGCRHGADVGPERRQRHGVSSAVGGAGSCIRCANYAGDALRVPALGRIPAPFARRVLGLLGCRVGAARRVHSKTVAKGNVIRSTPGAGTYSAGRVVTLQVSSGPVKRHR
jgi:hypothetical protein